jgi:nucleoside-diphosphate-sugar epimerase
MRLVVTGATGFVGSHFVERALQGGHEVVGICNSRGGNKSELRAALIAQGAELVTGDILEPSTLQATKRRR